MFESIDVMFEVICWLLTILFRLVFVGFTIYLIYSLVRSFKLLKLNKTKRLKIKVGVLSVVLCVCILLGYTEPPAKIRVKMDTVTDAFNYAKQNSDGKDKNFSTNKMFGWISYWGDESGGVIKEIHMTDEEKAASMNVYPTYVFYGEVDGVEVYYVEARCTRWLSLGHLTIDLLGVPDDCYSISTKVYLIKNNECVAVNVIYYGFNPFFFLQFLNSPYFFYSPEIDFEEIISSIN